MRVILPAIFASGSTLNIKAKSTVITRMEIAMLMISKTIGGSASMLPSVP